MKKLIILFLLTLFLFAGCSKELENNNNITPISNDFVNETKVDLPVEKTVVCENFYIKSNDECCPDKNQNNICDNIDLVNQINIEYNSISKEITNGQYLKVIAEGTSDGKIDSKDKIKIYLKLDNKTKDVKVGEIILKMEYVGGGKTMYYNKTYGIEVYNMTYLSNDGIAFKQDYLTSKDIILLEYTPDVQIKNSEYLYLKIFTNSGLYIPIHINTPKTFSEEKTVLYK